MTPPWAFMPVPWHRHGTVACYGGAMTVLWRCHECPWQSHGNAMAAAKARGIARSTEHVMAPPWHATRVHIHGLPWLSWHCSFCFHSSGIDSPCCCHDICGSGSLMAPPWDTFMAMPWKYSYHYVHGNALEIFISCHENTGQGLERPWYTFRSPRWSSGWPRIPLALMPRVRTSVWSLKISNMTPTVESAYYSVGRHNSTRVDKGTSF